MIDFTLRPLPATEPPYAVKLLYESYIQHVLPQHIIGCPGASPSCSVTQIRLVLEEKTAWCEKYMEIYQIQPDC